MKSEKNLKEIAKKDAKRFCRRNKVYETYDDSVANMIKKLYITTYLRVHHQIMSEVNQSESVKKPRPAVSTPSDVGYKSWSELTPMDKAVFRFTGGKLINCYWDYKRSPDSPMTPVVREVKDQKERNENDKITYVVGPRFINVWYLAKGEDHSEIKEMNPLTDDVKELCKRINL